MAKRKDTRDPCVPPGSFIERMLAFIWYGIIISLWLGLVSALDDFFFKVDQFNYEALAKRSDQTVVLTGGGRGIGLEVLKKLLRLDYKVILGVRNLSTVESVIEQIRKSGITQGKVKLFQLDLKSLESVRKFAENVHQETERIDILINNAGIMFEPYELTEDGFESHFQINYLSHYLLTQLLLPKMEYTGSTDCRIVNVSSLAHIGSSYSNMFDVSNPKVYSAFRAYYNSKLCQILFTKHLNDEMRSKGLKVSVYSVHPGVIPTDLYLSMKFIGRLTQIFKIFFRSIEWGSELIMYAAISPSLEGKGGSYISNLRCQKPSKLAEDLPLQQYLWILSQDCIKKTK